jgi:uncharacterized lipoprotein YddW (UPF0748 family)
MHIPTCRVCSRTCDGNSRPGPGSFRLAGAVALAMQLALWSTAGAQSAPVGGTTGGIALPAVPTISVPLPTPATPSVVSPGAAATVAFPGAASARNTSNAFGRVALATPETRPPAVPREFRAVWVSGVETPDWPSSAHLSAAQQQAEMRALLDRVQATGLNAIILHVRMGGDAMYRTPLAPWSSTLTGVSGGDPGYDPLAFAIREAHARGIAVHAWFNPFRAVAPGERGPFASNHVTRAHPDWIRRYGTQTWIDPGIPEARDTVLADIIDVVQRYDIDGVHIDDYFYPYRESVRETRREVQHTRSGRILRRHGKPVYRTIVREHEIDFPDDATFRQYGAGWADRVAWRRQNINAFVSDLYTAVHKAKPWLPVGISPFGIWRSGVADGVTGLDAFTEIAADSRLWLMQGWVDYLAPQLYWPLDGVQQRFVTLERWWRDQNPHGRHIWPGLLASSSWGAQETVDEVNEIRAAREGRADSPGQIHFRYAALERDNGLASALRAGPYARMALVPAMPWLERGMPPAPPAVTPERDGVAVSPGDSSAVAWWLVQWTDADATSASSSDAWQDRLVSGDVSEITWSTLLHHGAPRRVSITAIDRAGMAGRAVLVTQTTGAEPTPFPLRIDSVPRDSIARDSTARDSTLQPRTPNEP